MRDPDRGRAGPAAIRVAEAYTPPHLAEKILASRSALEGERKQVTVLFADLKGSLELLADRDPEEARALLDPVLERMMAEAVEDPAATGCANHPLFLAYLGEGHLLAGHPDQAVAVAQQGLDLARHQREGGNEAWVLRLLGEIAVRRDPPDAEAAERHYREALARADELGMRPLVAHCHLGLGTLHARAGDRAKARQQLTTAATLYREMEMGSWLARAAEGAML